MFVNIITYFGENTRGLQKVWCFLINICKSYPQFQKKLEDIVENRDGLFWIKRKTPTRRFWEC